MSTDRDTTRIVRSWLRTDEHESADRVLDAVLDQIPAIPQRRAGWPAWRTPIMNKLVTIGLGAAAVVVLLLFGAQLFGSPSTNVGGPGIDDSMPPEPSQTTTLTPPADGSLPEGSQHLLWDAGKSMRVTIPASGWHGEPGTGILVKNDNSGPPDGAGIIVFGRGDLFVYGDPCKWSTTRPETPLTTVDEVVAALAAQPSRDASAPTYASVSRYGGKLITLRVPDDAAYEDGRFTDCDQGEFRTFVEGTDGARYHQGPGQIDDLWVLDVEGQLVVIDVAYYDGTPEEHLSELDDIVDFMTFE